MDDFIYIPELTAGFGERRTPGATAQFLQSREDNMTDLILFDLNSTCYHISPHILP
jgi:hypothetical protein